MPQKSTILMIEDSQADVLLLKMAFARSLVETNIVWARDGDEALSILNSRFSGAADKAPDLILLDVSMPGLNGHETLKLIRNDSRFTNVPIIMLTGSRHESDVERAVDLGATSYANKTSNLPDLFNLVRNISDCWLPRSIRNT